MDRNERSNYLFDLAYMNAMGDATRRTNVGAGFKDIFLNTKDYKCSNSAKISIKKYIDNTMSGNNSNFNRTASHVIRQLCRINNEYTGFDFGNAQKLINMTAKYLFTMLYNSDDMDLRDSFSRFHCPMDSKMIDTVTKKYSDYLNSLSIQNEMKKLTNNLFFYIDANGKPCRKGQGNKTNKWASVNWTDINRDTKYIYDKYQKMVGILANEEELLPLEYDLRYWKR